MKKQTIAIALSFFIYSSCSERKAVEPLVPSQPVQENAQSGVLKIVVLSEKDKKWDEIEKLYKSVRTDKSETNDLVAANYTYEEGNEAVIFGSLSNDKVAFADITFADENGTKKILKMVWNDQNQDLHMAETEIELFDITDPTNPITVDASPGGSWGGCMKDAIKLLYDDWDNDPGGTAACWATGVNCAYGAGIACGIKKIWSIF